MLRIFIHPCCCFWGGGKSRGSGLSLDCSRQSRSEEQWGLGRREVRSWGVFQAVATRYAPLLFPHNHNYTYNTPGGITNRATLSLSTLSFSCKKWKINNFGNKEWRKRNPPSPFYTGEHYIVTSWEIIFSASYPMIRFSDMDENMRREVMDVCTSACERHTANNELVSARSIVYNS